VKIPKLVPRIPFSLSDPVFTIRQLQEYPKQDIIKKSDRAVTGGRGEFEGKKCMSGRFTSRSRFKVQRRKYRG